MKIISYEQQPTWIVERHSGRDNSKWRILYQGWDDIKAHDIYAETVNKLRQGAVRLSRGNKVIKETSAPRLRTRW